MNNLQRANKLTVYHAGDNVMIGIFYKTNKKLGQVCSNDEKVGLAGFIEPKGIDADNTEGLPATMVTPADKLQAYREFLIVNATVFGFIYDPVDRRPESEKYPNQYNESNLKEYAMKVISDVLTEIVNNAQDRVINKMVSSGHIVQGTMMRCELIEAGIKVDIQESYKNGNIKYATVSFPVKFGITSDPKMADVVIDVNLVSGQLKKPRSMGNFVLTANGVKLLMVEAGILPKIERVKEEEDESTNGVEN